MKISFNPSNSNKNILDLIKDNKDIIFDLKGHSIFARGVEFKGTDTNTWRPVVDNLTSDSTTSSLSAKQGKVLKALIDGKSNSDHNHDERYLRLTGGWMSGDINFGGDNKIHWERNTNSASISFKNDGDANSYMSFVTSDNGNEYFRWSHSSGSTNTEWMALKSDGLRVRGTKVSLEGHTHDDRYYTKAESNAKYITDITTSVNKLTFTRNGSNIIRDITVNVVHSQGYLTNIPNKDATTKASSGLYIYNSYNQVIGTNSYSSVLSINTGGTIQIAGNWGDDHARNLYWRSQSDKNVADYPWKSWRTILDSENYSSTLDSRYYTESEVNSLLDAKLNRQNLSYGTWNPRGWNLAADYNYNGGDLSISENNGKMYISVDGCFWQNEGQYRVLDTSDIGDIRSKVTLHQFLSATDAAWYPLIWGGDSHNNTSDSTGAVYKSYDKLSWQTSSQTLYATNIQTNNIKNLSIGGGIYWNPNVESATDGSNAASITLVKSGVAGGSTLVLSQMNDTNDTIQFKTNTAARLYHNSYPILTTQNTYVSNNKGYINGTEITYVNNSDMVDGYHENSFLRYRGATNTDQEATLWSQIGIKEYYGALPDGLTDTYNWGGVISLPGTHSRFEIYASHWSSSSSSGNGLYYRSGWDSDKKTWLKLIDSSTIGSQTVTNAYHLHINSANSWSTWYWEGQSGQPSWLWGSNDGTNMYVWNPSNFNVNTAQYLRSLGNQNCQTGRTQAYGDVYSYNTYDGNTGSPTTYSSVIGFGRGIYGTVEIAGGWCNTHLYWRSLRDCYEDWFPWRTVLDSSNYTEFINNYYWANVKISASSSTTTSPTVHTLTATRVCAGHNPGIDNSISCSNWFRSSGNTGWYNTTYQGGWYMSDTSWIRAHNGVGIYTSGQIYSSSSIRMSNILLEHTDEINNSANGGIYLNYRNSGNVNLCYGGGKVGIGTTAPSYKLDVNGQMRASGFHHASVNSDNYMLLAGGGYKSFGGDDSTPIFLGYLNLQHGDDGTISSSFYCLGYSVPFTYTRGGNYCKIIIPDTTRLSFFIMAATASVNYSVGGMDTWTGYYRGSGTWWLHCYAFDWNEVRVKGFCPANEHNDSWWGGNPLWNNEYGANKITVCIFGHVKYL